MNIKMMNIRITPLKNKFTFNFLDETAGGNFIDRTKSGIIMTNQEMLTTSKNPRWGVVQDVGSEVKDFKQGDYVLIEAMQWTNGVKLEEWIWQSDDSKVLAIADDIKDTYFY